MKLQPKDEGIVLEELSLNVLLISNSKSRMRIIEAGLENAVTTKINSIDPDYLSKTIKAAAPHVMVVDCENPTEATIKNMKQVTQSHPMPIIMFVEGSDGALTREAIRSGITAYIVDGLTPARVRPVIDMAIERFKMVGELKDELKKSKQDLEARKLIERAKGILMQQRGLSEADAFKSMRDLAMKESVTIKKISENIISVSSLLQGDA